MAKRLVRAKHKIEHAGIPYRVPPAHLLPERTSGVLAVLYLMFNEGYAASTGDELIKVDLCAEAIRLAGLLNRLMPDEPESGWPACAAAVPALPAQGPNRPVGRRDHAGGTGPFPLDPGRDRPERTRFSTRPFAGTPSGPTRCKLSSPLATPTRHMPVRPTGPGSPPCTSGSSRSQRIRSSSSTTPSPSGWQPAPRMDSRSSPDSKRRASCATTTSCTRLAQTSFAGWAETPKPRTRTAKLTIWRAPRPSVVTWPNAYKRSAPVEHQPTCFEIGTGRRALDPLQVLLGHGNVVVHCLHVARVGEGVAADRRSRAGHGGVVPPPVRLPLTRR